MYKICFLAIVMFSSHSFAQTLTCSKKVTSQETKEVLSFDVYNQQIENGIAVIGVHTSNTEGKSQEEDRYKVIGSTVKVGYVDGMRVEDSVSGFQAKSLLSKLANPEESQHLSLFNGMEDVVVEAFCSIAP